MAVTQVPENKPVVVGVDGTKMVLSPSESAQFNLLPGVDAGVLDETTGIKRKGIKAKTIRKVLWWKPPPDHTDCQACRVLFWAYGFRRTGLIQPCANFQMS